MGNSQFFRDRSTAYFDRVKRALDSLDLNDVVETLMLVSSAREEGTTVFVIGNGGSASTASHMACDLAKTIQNEGNPGLRIISLVDNLALLTALGNDVSFEDIFSKQVELLGKPGDILVSISGSGNSENCVRAMKAARELQMTTLALLGMDGGAMLDYADHSVIVPSDDYGVIEDVHMILNHLITDCLKTNQKTDLA